MEFFLHVSLILSSQRLARVRQLCHGIQGDSLSPGAPRFRLGGGNTYVAAVPEVPRHVEIDTHAYAHGCINVLLLHRCSLTTESAAIVSILLGLRTPCRGQSIQYLSCQLAHSHKLMSVLPSNHNT